MKRVPLTKRRLDGLWAAVEVALTSHEMAQGDGDVSDEVAEKIKAGKEWLEAEYDKRSKKNLRALCERCGKRCAEQFCSKVCADRQHHANEVSRDMQRDEDRRNGI